MESGWKDVLELKREKLNAMVKNAIKLQITEAEACLEQNGGPHLGAFREAGDPFGTPAPCWQKGHGRVGNPKENLYMVGSLGNCTTLGKGPATHYCAAVVSPDGWAAGELDVAHRWKGTVQIVDIKANRGHGVITTELRTNSILPMVVA